MFAAASPKSEMTTWKHNIHNILTDHFWPLLLCVRISLLAYTAHIISLEKLSIFCVILTKFLNSSSEGRVDKAPDHIPADRRC